MINSTSLISGYPLCLLHEFNLLALKEMQIPEPRDPEKAVVWIQACGICQVDGEQDRGPSGMGLQQVIECRTGPGYGAIPLALSQAVRVADQFRKRAVHTKYTGPLLLRLKLVSVYRVVLYPSFGDYEHNVFRDA